MTKVTVKVISDTISKNGRHITLTIISTDDSVVNDFLSLPININKTFANNTSLQDIKKEMKQETKSLIDSAKARISTDRLVGKELTFTV